MVKSLRLFEPRRIVAARPREKSRGNRHERGYDYEWTKTAASHLKKFPLCVECEREGRTVLAKVVDHKIPVRHRPDLRLDKRNHWGLCDHCHNGLKRRLEAYAEKANIIDALMEWCDNPESRPNVIKFDRRRKRDTMVV